MQYSIYLEIRGDRLIYKNMEPEDTLNYKYVLSDEMDNPLIEGWTTDNLDSINKNFAMICYTELMDLRLTMTTQQVRGKKLLKQEKYYEEVMAAYLDYFQGKEIQFPQWKLDAGPRPMYVINLIDGEHIRLTRKQGLFVRLFYDHFCQSRIGKEWLWFKEAYNMLDEDVVNPEWFGLSDIFEGAEGREKINKLFDVKPEGSRRYYRIKTVV